MNWISSTLGAGLLGVVAARRVRAKKVPREEKTEPRESKKRPSPSLPPPNIVATTEVGGPENLSEKHTISTSFHDFQGIDHRAKRFVTSPVMSCFGYPSRIQLYPGGQREIDGEPWMSVFLRREYNEKIAIRFTIRIGSFSKTCQKLTLTSSSLPNWGWIEYLPRCDVLDPANGYLENGILKVQVDIQVWNDTPVVWVPTKRARLNDMLESLESEDEGDTCFVVGDKRFVVYRGLIARSAPILGEIAAATPPKTDIPIDDVESATFGGLLHFIYTDELPENIDSRSLFHVANQFGCSRLKLIVEAEIVKAGIEAENAAKLLLFADAHSCALLREVALEFCLSHPKAIKESKGWEQLRESPDLLAELLGSSPTQFSKWDYDTMRVASLRQKLDARGLEVDGTRETLIRRLTEADDSYCPSPPPCEDSEHSSDEENSHVSSF